jgi:cytochrome c oxidase assembly protein subunit 15
VTSSTAPALGLHRFAVALAGSTLVLIFVGGLVTSTGSGLAVPDWPLSFGQFFPEMVGGVLYEHGHRMVATVVGFLTVVLALAAWWTGAPRLVRRLAVLAIGIVIAQGVLGGITVLWLLPTPVSVAHACLAQAFLCLTVAIAAITAPSWERMRAAAVRSDPALRTVTVAAAVAVYLQLILGAVMRHTGAGLAIPDFPLAFGGLIPPFELPGVTIHFLHRLGAIAVTATIVTMLAYVRAHHAGTPRLTRPAHLAGALVILQVTLGALTIWTGKAVLPTTAHVACGAAILATTFLLAMRARRSTRPAPDHAGALVRERVAA